MLVSNDEVPDITKLCLDYLQIVGLNTTISMNGLEV
jgi:hypothetical protein